jgi:hypothetical protein
MQLLVSAPMPASQSRNAIARKRMRLPGVDLVLSSLGAAVLVFLLVAGILSAFRRHHRA